MATARKEPLGEDKWAEIELQWRAGTSNAQLSRLYDITRQAIIDRARRYNWTKTLQARTESETLTKLHEMDLSTEEGQQAAIEWIAQDRAGVIQRHQQAWVGIHRILADADRILQGKELKFLKPDDVLLDKDGKRVDENGKPYRDTLNTRLTLAGKITALFEKRASSLMMAQEGERRSHGFDYKSQAEGEQVDERARAGRLERIRNTIERIAPAPSAKMIEGEVAK